MEGWLAWGVVIVGTAACGRSGFDELSGDGAITATDGKGGSTEEILDGPLPDVTLATNCVTWSDTVHGPAVGLLNDGFDVVSAGGGIGVAAYGLVASSTARSYLEIYVVTQDDNAEIAIKDDSTTQLDEYHADTDGKNVHYDNFEAELIARGAGWSLDISRDQSTFRSGDTVMWALDHAAGLIWYGRNGMWLGGGNPATGTNATFHAREDEPWFPSVYAEDSARFQIRGSAADQMYPVPAGFESFAQTVGLGDGDCIAN